MVHRCPFCGAPATIRDTAEIYQGQSFGLALICTRFPKCQAFVSCHRKTGEPMGTMADAELRGLRRRAHAAFDPLWKVQRWPRRDAYTWLAATLNINRSDCHIGMMDAALCRRVITACQPLTSKETP